MPASVSSFVSTPDEEVKPAERDDAEDVNIDSTKASAVQGIFGVLYTVTKEKDTQSLGFVLFKLVADFLQLFLLLVNPIYGYDIKYYSKGWEVVNFIGLNQFFAARGYTFFIIFLYVFVAMLLMVCATSFWVAWSFQNNRFDHVWPIIFLKIFSNVFFQVLDVASLSLFLITLDCNYFDVPDSMLNKNAEFPSVECWSMPHLIHVMVSAASLVVFVFLASLVNMAEIELNPVSKNPMAMGHSKVELVGFLLRMGITMVNTFVTNRKWMSIIQLLLSWVLVWEYTVWIPHMAAVTNYVRSASYAATFYCSILTVAISFKPGVAVDDPEAVYSFQRSITTALWAGMPIAAAVGAAAAWGRTYFFNTWVLGRFRDAPLGTKAQAIYKFSDPREVEIVARCCRKWVAEDQLDAEAVKLAGIVIKAGLAQLPTEAYTIILYSSFLIDVHGSYQSGYSQLQAVEKMQASFLEQFAVFSREQQHTQKAAGGKSGQANDLVSYVEFQRNYRLAQSVHREALVAERAFWRCLMRGSVSFATLSEAVLRIDTSVKNAERVYRTVIQRHQSSWKLFKMYARFLEVVKNDPWSAVKWNKEAEKLQIAEEEARNDVFGELERNAGDDDDEGVKKAKEIRAQMDDSRAVIIINAKGEITLTNQAATDILGHSKAELLGRNIKLIIPSPFSDHHDSYLRKYAVTSKANILGLTREFVALHKERYVLAVVLTVSQIRGSGEDASFMGVIEPVPHTENTAKAWFMTSGAIVSVDAYFQDWFGYRNEDLLGTFVSSLVVEHKQLSEFLKTIKEAGQKNKEGDTGDGGGTNIEKEWEIDGLHIKHKFTESVAVYMSIRPGGAGNHSFYVMTVQRHSTHQDHMLVCDTRGRVQHCTQELAGMLGYTPHSIMANGAPNAVDAIIPQPYAQLHRKHIADGLPPLAGPHSCISGIAVCLKSIVPDAPPLTPFKLKLQQKHGSSGNARHVITFAKTTVAEALDERRLSLLVNASGIITSVTNSPESLFGMDPMEMLGKPVSRYIDGLKPVTGTAADGSLPEDPELRQLARETDTQDLEHLIMQLAKRSTEVPGCSWRVGVAAPIDEGQLSGLGDLAQHFMQHRTKPAVMTASIRVSGALAARRRSIMRTETLKGRFPIMGPSSTHTSDRDAEDGPLDRNSMFNQLAARRPKSSKRASSMMLEISLWRADLLSGVMEVDSRGKIVNVAEHMLNPPGLLFGVPNEKLLNKRVSSVLPLGDRPVSALFESELGGGPGAIKSRLKKPSKPVDGRLQRTGKVNNITIQHFVDFAPLELQVQAVHKWGNTGRMYIIMHVVRPSMAPANFRDLISQDLTLAVSTGRMLRHLESVHQNPVNVWGNRRESGQVSDVSGPIAPSSNNTIKGVRMAPGLISGPSGRVVDAPGRSKPAQLPAVPEGSIISSQAGAVPGTAAGAGPADSFMRDAGMLGPHNATGNMLTAQQTGSSITLMSHRQNSSSAPSRHMPSYDADRMMMVMGLDSHITESELDGDGGGEDGGQEEDPFEALQLQQLEEKRDGGTVPADQGSVVDDDSKSVDEGSAAGQSANESDPDSTDYRRGRRYKKLMRLLAATNGARVMRKFKLRTFGVVGVVLLLHIATFIAMLTLISKQKDQVDELNSIGFTARSVMEVMVVTRAVEIVLSNMTQPHLAFLNDSTISLQVQLDDLWDSVHRFMAGHSGTYLGFGSQRRMPDTLSVKPQWDSPINSVVVFSMGSDGNLTSSVRNASLWDIGNSYAKAALNVWQNSANQSSGVSDDGAISVEADRAFILENGHNVLSQGYFATLDSYVDMVISSSQVINQAQLIIITVEGCLVAILAVSYMWALATRVGYHRHTLYNVFVLVPIGLIRGLATREIVVEGKEADPVLDTGLEGEDVVREDEEGAEGGGARGHQEPAIKFSAFEQAALAPPETLTSRVLATLMWWRPKAKVAPAGRKRQLSRSYGMAVWLTWPFAMWGVMIIVINAVGLKNMEKVETAIAIFNMINFVNIRYHRTLFYMQELCRDTNPVTREQKRAEQLSRWRAFNTEYRGMMYGHQAVPEQTSVHFVRATDGLVTYGADTTTLMFNYRNCLAIDQNECQQEGAEYYELTHNGVDLMIKHMMEKMKQTYYSVGDEPNLASEEYAYMWNTFPNVEGGLAEMNSLVHQAVNKVYESVVRVHVVALVLTLVIMGAYLLLILRRYLAETKGETRRIAELLTQLGADVDMEGMLKAVLFTGEGGPGKKRTSNTGQPPEDADEEAGFAGAAAAGRGWPPPDAPGRFPAAPPPGSPMRGRPFPANGTMGMQQQQPYMNGFGGKAAMGMAIDGPVGWQGKAMRGSGDEAMPMAKANGMSGVAMGNGMNGMQNGGYGSYGNGNGSIGMKAMQNGMNGNGRGGVVIHERGNDVLIISSGKAGSGKKKKKGRRGDSA